MAKLGKPHPWVPERREAIAAPMVDSAPTIPRWTVAGPGSLYRAGKLLGPGETVEMTAEEAEGLPTGTLRRV